MLRKWGRELELVRELLSKWAGALMRWKRFAPAMSHSHKRMPEEFHEFRICAKYWRRLARLVDDERLVIKITRAKHVGCWLLLVDGHLAKMIEVNCRLGWSRFRLIPTSS